MVWLVLSIGILNFALGFALAVCVTRPERSRWAGWALQLLVKTRILPSVTLGQTGRTSAPTAKANARQNAQPRPETRTASLLWNGFLLSKGVRPASGIESLLWGLHFKLADFREQIVSTDQRFRADRQHGLADDELRSLTGRWTGQLREWAALAGEEKADPCWRDLSSHVEGLLLDQSWHVESVCERILGFNKDLKLPGSQRAILRETNALFEAANALRDRVDVLLARVLREENRLESVPEPQRDDPLSETVSRLGLELLFDTWTHAEAGPTPVLSALLVDMDRLGRLNEQWGILAGDRTIAAFGRLLMTLVRQERGFDRVARFCGPSFLIFLGETPVSDAVNGAERIRQTIEATSFKIDDEKVELTASCAVAQIGEDESVPGFYERLGKTLDVSKQAGRNRTSVDEGRGPRVVEQPQYRVKGRVVDVADRAQDSDVALSDAPASAK